MSEHDRVNENLQSPEFTTARGSIALQARLMKDGNYLSPDNKSFPKLQDDELGKPDEIAKTVTLLSHASTTERRDFWKQKAQENGELSSHDKQYQAWSEGLIHSFQDSRNQNIIQVLSQMHIGSGDSEIHFGAFNKSEVDKLYKRYFTGNQEPITITTIGGEVKAIPSNIKQYIDDILKSYTNQNNQLDYQRLNGDRQALQFIGNIFGGNSNEIINELIDAQAKLSVPEQKQQFLKEMNEERTIDNQNQIRLNCLNTREEVLLRWLNQETTEIKTQTSLPNNGQGKGRFSYSRLDDDPRIFPDPEMIKQTVDPNNIAHLLKDMYPDEFGSTDIAILKQNVIQQKNQFDAWLQNNNLGQEYLGSLIAKAINHYEAFIKDKYGIRLPKMEKVTIVPLFGYSSRIFNPNRALALATSNSGAIFLDFGTIIEHAKNLGIQMGQPVSRDTIGKKIEELLLEINPHEYTHLCADIAYWSGKKNQNSTEKAQIIPARVGLKLVKPIEPYFNDNGSIIATERGRGLMEAVTVELTSEWAKSFNATLDINAYHAERKVLHTLIQNLVTKRNISEHEALTLFAKAYFHREDFLPLSQILSGRKVDTSGKITYDRPHFMSILYALMEYEGHTAANPINPREPTYELTRHFIENTFTPQNKQEIQRFIQMHGNIQLSPATIEELTRLTQ